MNNNNHLEPAHQNQPVRRPFSVTILIMVVLIYTSLNALRMITAIQDRDFLQVIIIDIPVLYLVITGAIWSGVGALLLFGLWTRRKWSQTMAFITVIIYSFYYWSDSLLMADRSAIANRWPFDLGLTILLLILSFWNLTSTKSQTYFSK